MVTTTSPLKRGPGRPRHEDHVVSARPGTRRRGRPRKEDVGGSPSPVSSNLFCTICHEPIRLLDLLEHAAEHNRKAAARPRRRMIAANQRGGKQRSVPV